MIDITNIIVIFACLILASIAYKILKWLAPVVIIILLTYLIYVFLF